MTSPPPDAAGLGADREQYGAPEGPEPSRLRADEPPAIVMRHDGAPWQGTPPGRRPPPSTRPSSAPVELTLDLRMTAPDKVLGRLMGALDRVAADVTLLVLVRDTPDYVGVLAGAHQALRGRGYVTDSSRMPAENSRIPAGGQRLRVHRRREPSRGLRPDTAPAASYAPVPESARAVPSLVGAGSGSPIEGARDLGT